MAKKQTTVAALVVVYSALLNQYHYATPSEHESAKKKHADEIEAGTWDWKVIGSVDSDAEVDDVIQSHKVELAEKAEKEKKAGNKGK